MTSGQFRHIPVSSITINREDRQRKVIDDIDGLADSIRHRGLIHPPVVTRDHVLVSGERRLTAVKSLGWDQIPVQYVDEVDPEVLFAIELEENVKRKDISWQERVAAVSKYHDHRSETEEEWKLADSAKALGITEQHVSKSIKLNNAIKNGVAGVATSPTLQVADNIVARLNERAAQAELSRLITPKAASPFICADFNEWAPAYTGPLFNFIHCDFPYGVNVDKWDFQSHTIHSTNKAYGDDFDTYQSLCRTLRENLSKLAAPDTNVIFWFSMYYYQWTLNYFEGVIRFDPFPLIWHKSDNIGLLPDPRRGPRRIYETALWGRIGDRPIVRTTGNVASFPAGERSHRSAKADAALDHFFRMCVDGSTSILDPTCGAGSAIRAARRLGAHRYCGLDISNDFISIANAAYRTEFPNDA